MHTCTSEWLVTVKVDIVPSIWKESVVVAVPKKQARGACEVDNFCGVSLSSTVCKVMCR